jgi:glucose-6-phosphate isomerase
MRLSVENSRVSDEAFARAEKRLASYVEHLQDVARTKTYAYHESSINLALDAGLLNESLRLAKKFGGPKLRIILVIGIGGSNLGTKAVYDAVCGSFDTLHPERTPKMLFADTCDPRLLQSLEHALKTISHPDEIVVNLVSKSGGTTESMVNAEILLQALSKKLPHATQRLVVTTDVGSKLWTLSEAQGIERLPIPDLIGGRYSVLSPVGLFPLALAGINIKGLLRGAEGMRKRCLLKNTHDNPAMQSATVVFAQMHGSKKNINDTFLFHPELESLGKWYRQLMGESLGKAKTRAGKQPYGAPTPTVSIGSTDLHSMGQLYLGGPKDKLTTFVSSKKTTHANVPKKLLLPGLVEHTAGQDAARVMDAILHGVLAAFRKQQVPFMHLELDDLSPESLGAFLQFKMFEIMFLGEFLDVNAFDQPQVELYKVETKKLL